jgi:hypothetical protein
MAENYSLVNSCTTKSYEALMLGKINNGVSVQDYIRPFNVLGDVNLNRSSGIPNYDAPVVKYLFANSSFTKREATNQIQAQIKTMQDANVFVKWLRAYNFCIKQYRQLF